MTSSFPCHTPDPQDAAHPGDPWVSVSDAHAGTLANGGAFRVAPCHQRVTRLGVTTIWDGAPDIRGLIVVAWQAEPIADVQAPVWRVVQKTVTP